MKAFDVMVGDHLIDIVYGVDSMTAREMRRSLIEHDGYSTRISVYRNAANRRAYDDMARVTHPEEL